MNWDKTLFRVPCSMFRVPCLKSLMFEGFDV